MADYLTIFLYVLMPILGIYLLMCIVRMSKAPSPAKGLAIAQENTDAVKENSQLLRELIVLNRQLLEKQNQVTS